MLDLCVQRVFTELEIPTDSDFSRWLKVVLKGYRQHSIITLRIVDEAESAKLNFQYRNKNRATNVLSFPAEHDFPTGLPAQQLLELEAELGDLVICAPVVQAEARQQGKAVNDHWAHLLIHGCLHLLGFDHIDDKQAETMEAIEIAALAELSIDDPYL